VVAKAGRKLLRPFRPVLKPAYERLQELYNYSSLRVVQRSPYDNIYYCCTQKTASQWFRMVLCDPIVFQYTGLRPFRYRQLGLREAHFDRPLPPGTIGIHLYVDYATYAAIPKPDSYTTFFILRDPRDIVVSWYFSAKYSHKPVDPIPELRRNLEPLDLQDGLKYIIDAWDGFGLFEAQRSWMTRPEGREPVKVFRYEEFAADNRRFLEELLDYLEIQVPSPEFEVLYDRHRFSQLAKGRRQGVEDPQSHFRKGVSGDWENYFDDAVMAHFREVTGDLLETLGYEG
jgi:hypothetical protein